jgi:hypothetical protein
LLAHRQPQTGGSPLFSVVRDCFCNTCGANIRIWRRFLHPQPENSPCRGDRDPLVTVTGTHLLL